MKVKEDFLLRQVADCYVVVPVGDATVDFNGMLNLNETGAFLWDALKEETNREEVIAKLLSEYDVPKETAENDVDKFIARLNEVGLIE